MSQILDEEHNLRTLEDIKCVVPGKGELWFQYAAMKHALTRKTILEFTNNEPMVKNVNIIQLSSKKYKNYYEKQIKKV